MEEKKSSSKHSRFAPLVFLVLYVGVVILIKFYLPSPKEILLIVEGFYRQFGYFIVLISGLLESLFLIGFYLPGSAAILLGAALARDGVIFLPLVILLGTVGLVTGYTVNYILGRHGWYHVLSRFGFEGGLVSAEKKLKTHQKKTLFLGYISPALAAFVSTAAGIMKVPFKTFFIFTCISQLFWSTVWGTVAYLVGNIFVEYLLQYAPFIIYGIVAILFLRQAVKAGLARWF